MSLRPQLYAAAIAPLLALAQSRNAARLPELMDWLRRNLREPTPLALEKYEEAARRLLNGEAAGSAESDDDVNLVYAMAEMLGMQEASALIADGDWNWSAWNEYLVATATHIDARALSLLEVLVVHGRPLFGSEIDTTWLYYGYLHNAEARYLLSALDALVHCHPAIRSGEATGEFHGALTGWLREVARRGMDIWMFAS